MHGLINRSIQCFLRDTYGVELWAAVAAKSRIGVEGFEALLTYDDAVTDLLVDEAAAALGKQKEAFLEDVGIYLVGLEPLRRLLRFGGVDYVDFLQSLDELPERVHLAVPDLEMPDLSLVASGPGRFTLICKGQHPGFGAVFAGILRAMAGDYGALVLIDAGGGGVDPDAVSIELLETQFALGRRFELARPMGV